MKLKLTFALVAAIFAGTFTISSAQATDAQCYRACFRAYLQCVSAMPNNTALCVAYREGCLMDCGYIP